MPHCATQRYHGMARTKPEIYLRIQFLPHRKRRTYPLQRKFGWGNKRYFVRILRSIKIRYVGRIGLLNFKSDGIYSNHSISECQLFCGTMLNNNVSQKTTTEGPVLILVVTIW